MNLNLFTVKSSLEWLPPPLCDTSTSDYDIETNHPICLSGIREGATLFLCIKHMNI